MELFISHTRKHILIQNSATQSKVSVSQLSSGLLQQNFSIYVPIDGENDWFDFCLSMPIAIEIYCPSDNCLLALKLNFRPRNRMTYYRSSGIIFR
jgi:hypothetical protein